MSNRYVFGSGIIIRKSMKYKKNSVSNEVNINSSFKKSILFFIVFMAVCGLLISEQPASSNFQLTQWGFTSGNPNEPALPLSAAYLLDFSSMGGIANDESASPLFQHHAGFQIPAMAAWGCTDPEALNFNPEANLEDGSCIYCGTGDLDNNELLNVLDIVLLVDVIINPENETEYFRCAGDVNNDGNLNVIDIVIIVDMILESG